MKDFFSLPLKSWIDTNMSGELGGLEAKDHWQSLFMCAIASVWFWRNKLRLDPEFVPPSNPVMEIYGNTEEVELAQRFCIQKQRRCVRVQWQPPMGHFVKINTEVFSWQSRLCGHWWVNLRQSWALDWRILQKNGTGKCYSYGAVGHNARLLLAWEWGFRLIVLETDSLEAVSLIQHPTEGHAEYNLVAQICQVLGWNWTCHISHGPREANQCAVFLAHEALKGSMELQIFMEPPIRIRPLLALDAPDWRFPS